MHQEVFATHNESSCAEVMGVSLRSGLSTLSYLYLMGQTIQQSYLACLGYINNKGRLTLETSNLVLVPVHTDNAGMISLWWWWVFISCS